MNKILLIGDDLDAFKIKTDTTYFLLLCAKQLKLQIFYCQSCDVYSNNNNVFADASQLEILHSLDGNYHTDDKWYCKLNLVKNIRLDDFAVVMVRTDPPFNMEYYYLTQLLSIAEENGANIVNSSVALRNFNEKLSILNFPQFITPTLVSKNMRAINDFIDHHQECVLKPIDLMAGRGIFKVTYNDVNRKSILETLSNFYTQTVMVQKFIPEVIYGDKRIFVVNGKVIDYCLYRIPQSGEIRGNIAAGGRGEVHAISANDKKLATEVASWLSKKNIKFAGLDVIGSYLTEINITSPTGTWQIYKHAGINIPLMLLEGTVNVK